MAHESRLSPGSYSGRDACYHIYGRSNFLVVAVRAPFLQSLACQVKWRHAHGRPPPSDSPNTAAFSLHGRACESRKQATAAPVRVSTVRKFILTCFRKHCGNMAWLAIIRTREADCDKQESRDRPTSSIERSFFCAGPQSSSAEFEDVFYEDISGFRMPRCLLCLLVLLSTI